MDAMNLGPPTQICEHCGAQLWYFGMRREQLNLESLRSLNSVYVVQKAKLNFCF